MIDILYAGSVSACFELSGDRPYYAEKGYRYTLTQLSGKDRTVQTGEDNRNVFSAFSLRPSASYGLKVEYEDGREETAEFKTKAESCAVNVKDFGAAGDGSSDDTQAIQMAVSMIPPGGRIRFPKGIYITKPLTLKSGITLELDEKAVLKASAIQSDYDIIPACVSNLDGGSGLAGEETAGMEVNGTDLKDGGYGEDICFGTFEGLEQPMYASLIMGQYVSDVTICGRGTIDGSGPMTGFWKNFSQLPAARPRLIMFNGCSNVVLHGVHCCDSSSWHIHPFYSDNISLYDISVTAHPDSPNTDAVDPESCRGVNIIGCRFSVGDDCIAIKSGKLELAAKRPRACERITVRNCLMEFGHGAVTLGSETSSGVKSLNVTRCLFRDTDRGLRIKTRRGRGSSCNISDIDFEDIEMDGVKCPVVLNMWYNCCDPDRYSEYVWSREALPADDRTPHLGTFKFSNIRCTGVEYAAAYIDGLPEMPVDSVSFENFSAEYKPDARAGKPAMRNHAELMCKAGLYFDNVRKVSLKNVSISGSEGSRIIEKNCGEITEL